MRTEASFVEILRNSLRTSELSSRERGQSRQVSERSAIWAPVAAFLRNDAQAREPVPIRVERERGAR